MPGTEHQALDEHYYALVYQPLAVRAELDQLEVLLAAHVAAGGPHLPRLELRIAIVHVVPQNMLTAGYYRIKDVPPSPH